MSQESTYDENATPLARAKKMAERIVSSMQAQGYREIEYILTECQLKIVASGTGASPRTQYLSIPTKMVSSPLPARRDGSGMPHKKRIVLN